MDRPIALEPGEGGFVEYRRELVALQEQGVEPEDAFFERHDVFDV
jgi:hypothetical protein